MMDNQMAGFADAKRKAWAPERKKLMSKVRSGEAQGAFGMARDAR